MDPESLKKQEIMDSWQALLENGSPEMAAIAKHVLSKSGIGYALGEILEGIDWEDELKTETEAVSVIEEFADNPEVVCVNNVGIEEHFDEGVTYVAELLDREFFVVYDRNGQKREVLAERFREVKDEKPEFEFKKFEPGTKVKITDEPVPYTIHYK